MDDWKLTSQAAVKLKKERNMFVSSYCVANFFHLHYYKLLRQSMDFVDVDLLQLACLAVAIIMPSRKDRPYN